VTLLALRRGSETTSIPDPETKFQPNDLLFVVGQPEKIVEISRIFKAPSGVLPAG
jgi:Trk K+ transport system NAD-binding subunit